jgi:hypothetical protein
LLATLRIIRRNRRGTRRFLLERRGLGSAVRLLQRFHLLRQRGEFLRGTLELDFEAVKDPLAAAASPRGGNARRAFRTALAVLLRDLEAGSGEAPCCCADRHAVRGDDAGAEARDGGRLSAEPSIPERTVAVAKL